MSRSHFDAQPVAGRIGAETAGVDGRTSRAVVGDSAAYSLGGKTMNAVETILN